MIKIGTLALQGAFIEHRIAFEKLGVQCVEVRNSQELENLDGIVFPGGESTVQGRLLHKTGLFEPLQRAIIAGLPVFATCAGLILLAQKLADDSATWLQTLPVVVRRNAYGRQLSSFQATIPLRGLGAYPSVFIRAPYISEVGEGVEVLAKYADKIAGVQYQNQLALAFHPEMTKDLRLHQRFITLIHNQS